MPVYLIHNNVEILNAIVAENKDDLIVDDSLHIMESIDGKPWIGWTRFDENDWRPPKPFESWQWDGQNWQAPEEMPEDNRYSWQWDEDNLQWKRFPVPQPFPSWTLGDDDRWIPPVPVPNHEDSFYWDEENQSWAKI